MHRRLSVHLHWTLSFQYQARGRFQVMKCGERRLQDPLAVVDAYMVHIRLRLAKLLGVRMCRLCPRCNDTNMPCQDTLGSNM